MMRIRTNSFRGKLLALIVGALLLAQASAALLSAWSEAGRYAKQKSETLLSETQVLAAACAKPLAGADASGIYASLRGAGKMPGLQYAAVYDRDGRLVADLGEAVTLAGDLAIDPDRPTLSAGDLVFSRTIQASAPIVQGGVSVGTMRVIGDASDFPARVGSAVSISALGGLVGLALAIGLALRFETKLTKPLRNLTRAVESARDEKRFGAAVEMEGADEVRVLIGGFNSMAEDIRERDQALARHMENLSHEVAARTADYRNAAAAN